MSDIVVTNRNNRLFYCARGWYKHKTTNKWARITVDKVKVITWDNEYIYDYKVGENVRSLKKEDWDRKRILDLPLRIFNRLEALV
jgi:hypothetical protein